MSDAVAVNITKRSGPADRIGTKHTVYVAEDGTLADLRVVLTDDEVTSASDKFYVDGRALGKSSEAKTKWKTALKNKEILVMGSDTTEPEITPIPKHVSAREGFQHATAEAGFSGSDEAAIAKARSTLQQDADFVFEDPRRVNELSDSERTLLLQNSGLGSGIDIRDADGPQTTGLPVIDDIGLPKVYFHDTDQGGEDVVVSYSARAAAYAKSGWAKLALSASTPWVSGSLEVSAEMSSQHEETSSTVSVTGRYMYSCCRVTFLGDVRPHPELRKAVERALEVQDPAKRTVKLGDVFKQYGHMYVASVELGGMKHTTSTRQNCEKKSKESFEAEMKLALGKKFGPGSGEVSVGGGVHTETSTKETSSFENETFRTVGGNTLETNITRWKASLAKPENWCVTRTIRVESVIDLFEDEIQTKILAAAPQLAPPKPQVPRVPRVPLYRMHSPGINDHFYTTNVQETHNSVRNGYTLEGIAALVCPGPADSVVPLYRMWGCLNHFYTQNAAEVNNWRHMYNDEGVACYIHPRKEEGTVPFYRMWNRRDLPSGQTDHLYTTDIGERDRLVQGGWSDEGPVGYVYPVSPY